MANKLTKKENFGAIAQILEGLGRTDLVAVMNHEIELLDKKASKAKMTKTQTANVATKDLIIKELCRLAKPVTITELLNASAELNTAVNGSNQKASALMTQLKNDGKVVRNQEGKKAVFTVAVDIEDFDVDAEDEDAE